MAIINYFYHVIRRNEIIQKIKNSLVKTYYKYWQSLISNINTLPDFLIIGGQKCGTTSLFFYLKEHSHVIPALIKEVHFFDLFYERGVKWYKSFFPSILSKIVKKCILRRGFITGEATPYYIFHPCVPKRISKTIPNAKIIMILRNPIDRAYSHYNMEFKKGFEKLSFEDAINKEEDRLNGEMEKIIQNKNYYSYNLIHYSYSKRGIYLEQIKNWYRYFPKKQILIIKSEDLDSKTQTILNKVFRFLEIPVKKYKDFSKHYSGRYSKMDDELRSKLNKFFKPYNELLYKFIGINFEWNN